MRGRGAATHRAARTDRTARFTGHKVEFEFDNGAGSQLAGTVWAPSAERLKKLWSKSPLPGIVYAPGVISAQPMYYWFAQEMADAGYVVMTYDLTGQGRSEGSNADDPPRDLRAALGFFLSAENPLRGMLDADRIGTAGHSLGAFAVQTVGDFGGVVKAISAHSDLQASYAGNVPIQGQGADYESFVFPPQPSPGSDPNGKLAAFKAIAARGVDVQEIVIESGTHMAWSHVTWAYTSVWSEAVALHYALAWFDRYLYKDVPRLDGVPSKKGKSGTHRTTMDFDAVGTHGLSAKFLSAYSLKEGACGDMTTCKPLPTPKKDGKDGKPKDGKGDKPKDGKDKKAAWWAECKKSDRCVAAYKKKMAAYAKCKKSKSPDRCIAKLKAAECKKAAKSKKTAKRKQAKRSKCGKAAKRKSAKRS